MKIRRRRAQLLLFVLASISTANALGSDLSASDLGVNAGIAEVGAAAGGNTGKRVGTKHAPVDGKDGMPHDGPFVETNADRTRKQQGAEHDEVIVAKESYENLSTDGDLPKTNDAVMDERAKSKPVDGTRGVEGGITEKSKEVKVSEKKPEQPKDARPIPHSEMERIKKGTEDNDMPATGEEETKKVLAVRNDHLGGIKLTLLTSSRSGTRRSPRKASRHSSPRKSILTQRQHPLLRKPANTQESARA